MTSRGEVCVEGRIVPFRQECGTTALRSLDLGGDILDRCSRPSRDCHNRTPAEGFDLPSGRTYSNGLSELLVALL